MESRLEFAKCFLKFLLFSIMVLLSGTIYAADYRKVKVGLFPAEPLVFKNNEKADGLFIELLEYIAGESGWDLDYVEKPWNELLSDLESGVIDLLPAIGISEERRLIYDYTDLPVYIDSGVLFTDEDFPLQTIFDLEGKKVAAVEGSIFTTGFIDYITSFGVSCKIVHTADNREVMQAIASGMVDAGVCIYSLGNELAKSFPVSITPINFTPIALGYAVPVGKNADIISVINQLTKSMKGDPDSFYSRTFSKWISPDSEEKISPWFFRGLILLLITGTLMLIWNISLKRQVRIKVRHLEIEISERKQIEKELNISLQDKDTLIHELYHRTKNTLQMVIGLLVLQAEDYPENMEIKYFVNNIKSRIMAVALVHQMLYQAREISKISIGEYVKNLAELTRTGFSAENRQIALELEIEEYYMMIDTAVPIAIILNELMTNSLKYAFPENRNGTIAIKMKSNDQNGYEINYSDDGVGVPEGFDFAGQKSLGLRLIDRIGRRQLRGEVDFKTENGFSCTVKIKKPFLI